MYQVLYRKYRPQTFDDVVGQEQVTKTLKNELKLNRINHAYLFTGSRGTGKTTCAKILSKAVNCLDLQDSNPCNVCDNCKGIDSGEILDVVEMDAASNRKIDNIRNIIDEVAFTPSKAKYRVYIIDEVHMLTNEAFNALLKTLEEPPKHVIFILATTEVHKLPATITSRCQRFDFHRISPKDISKRLLDIAEKENINLSEEASLLISVIADGALRDAISLLDRCIGISSDVDINVVRNAAGLASKNHLFELCNCMINKNASKALSIIDTLYKDSKDMARLCDELISHFRTLMLIKTVKNPRDMVALSDEEFEVALSQSDFLSLSDIVYYMDILQKSFERMGKGVSARIELETAIVKLTSPELESTNEALLSRISSLEKLVKSIKAGVSFDENISEIKTENIRVEEKKVEKKKESEKVEEQNEEVEFIQPKKEIKTEEVKEEKVIEEEKKEVEKPVVKKETSNSSSVDIVELSKNATLFLQWPEVVENLKKFSITIAAAFKDCDAYENGDYLLIDSQQKLPFDLLSKSSQRANIRQAVAEVTGKKYRLGPYKRETEDKEKKKDEVLDNFITKLKDSGIGVEKL